MTMRTLPSFRAARMRTAALALLAPALLGGCDLVVMNPAGDVARQQAHLILWSTGLMLLIIVPVIALTVLFAWKYRHTNEDAEYRPNWDHSTGLELIIWSAPLLIVIALGALTWISTHSLDPYRPLARIAPGQPVAKNAKPLEIQVVSLDWKWLFIYPDLGIATVNELALPVDVPVHFSITSTDQFNTLYVPTLAGMIYAMPTMKSELNAVINKPVTSEGYSGNYTGRGYSDMRFKFYGRSPDDFARWVSGIKAGGGALQTANYIDLAKPSEKVPVMRFASVQSGLFDRIVNRCVEPGKPCMVDVMARDMARAGGNPNDHRMGAGMAPGRGAAPIIGEKPVPALQKAPEDKGSGPNVTKPEKPGAPGQTKPGDQRNRDMSAVSPILVPGAARAVRA